MSNHIKYQQGEIIIKTSGQAMYEITHNINSWLIKEQINNGQLNIFIKHTSASLCIQENASEDVMEDILDYFTKIVPENGRSNKFNTTISVEPDSQIIRVGGYSIDIGCRTNSKWRYSPYTRGWCTNKILFLREVVC